MEVTPAERDESDRDRARVVDGFKLASFHFAQTVDRQTSTTRPDDRVWLHLPGGARWSPDGAFTVDKGGDLPFSRATANGDEVVVGVSKPFGALVTANGQVTARGTFEAADGRKVDELVLPRGTKAVRACPAGFTTCANDDERPFVTVNAAPGTVIVVDTALDTEAAVAGTAESTALGRTWTGLVAAVQGHGMKAAAIRGEHGWSLLAGTTSALQLWIDVWPVANTTLSSSVAAGTVGPSCDRYCSARLRWTNTGHASSQIFIAEGTGPGAQEVAFDLNKTLGHDAGLGVRRGDRIINLRGGADVDSNLEPGDGVDRGVTHGLQPAAIVLRGNFPEVRLDLP